MFWTAAKSDIEDPLMHELVMDVASQMSTIMLHARFSVDSHFENLVHAGVKDAGKDNYSCYLPSIRHEGMVADGLLVKSAFNMINKQNDKTKLFALGLTGVDMNDRSDQVSVAKLLGDNLMEPSSFMVFVDPYYECDQRGKILSTDGISKDEVRIANQLGIKCYNLQIEQHRDMLFSLIRNME